MKSEVLASRGGRAETKYQKYGMGKYIIIRHPGRFSTLYGHLSKILVEDGERVKQGQVIGLIGKTGNANYRGMVPHIHFEVRKNGVHVDPEKFLNRHGNFVFAIE